VVNSFCFVAYTVQDKLAIHRICQIEGRGINCELESQVKARRNLGTDQQVTRRVVVAGGRFLNILFDPFHAHLINIPEQKNEDMVSAKGFSMYKAKQCQRNAPIFSRKIVLDTVPLFIDEGW
jgi:hypothetical protein